MIPTAHLRLWRDTPHSSPVLQQLWAPRFGMKWPAHLEKNGGEWRNVPVVLAPIWLTAYTNGKAPPSPVKD